MSLLIYIIATVAIATAISTMILILKGGIKKQIAAS